MTQTYDERNRLIKNVKGTQTIEFGYFQDGLRKYMKDSTGTTSYLYWPDQSLRQVIYPHGETISYDYNDIGQLSEITEPFGEKWSYRYDQRNRLDFIYQDNDSNIHQVEYDFYPNGQLWKANQVNGVNAEYQYDGFNNLTSLIYTKGLSTISSYSFTHDNNGNIETRNENGTPSSFSYDELNRISSDGTDAYSYDKNGNRLTLTSTSLMIPADNLDFTYDEWNQLTQVLKNGATAGDYKYNGDGLLVEKTQNGTTTRYYYDNNDQIIAEGTVTPTGVNVVARYLRGYKNELVSREDSSNKKGYYVHNGHGDIVGLRNESGSVLNTYSYDIWGNPKTQSETIPNPFRYSGELWDDKTNLQYLRARWYDPSIGRFINEDTYEGELKNPLSLNLYTYVNNNPLKYHDPSGHSPVLEMGEGGGKVSNKEKSILSEWADQETQKAMLMLHGTLFISYGTQLLQSAMEGSTGNGGGMYFKGIDKTSYAREMGKIGESASGITKNTRRIESMTGKAKYRIPDGLDEISQTLTEVKNVKRQGYTSQLKDFHLWSKENGYDFVLMTRSNTKISKPLQQLIDSGDIIHKYIK